jgi:hypothetical protein
MRHTDEDGIFRDCTTIGLSQFRQTNSTDNTYFLLILQGRLPNFNSLELMMRGDEYRIVKVKVSKGVQSIIPGFRRSAQNRMHGRKY